MDMVNREDFETQALPQLDDLYSAAYYILGNESSAQYLVQESLAIAYHSWDEGKFNPNCRVRLFKIMVDVQLKRNQPFHGGLTTTINSNEYEGYSVHSWSMNQEQMKDSGRAPFPTISEDNIKRAIGDLSHDLRLIVVLFLLQGFSIHEVAEITGIQSEAVRSRLNQGRRFIRESLLEMWPTKANTICREENSGEEKWGNEIRLRKTM